MKSYKVLSDIIDENLSSIVDVVQDIEAHPELGYKEFRTSAIVNDFLRSEGYTTQQGLAVTGIKTKLKEGSGSPCIAVIGELDGITCPESRKADKLTGATHHCGHHLQLGVMMAVAQAFKQAGIETDLAGNIAFIAAPAEEYIELEYRSDLRESGKIRYFGGKQELVRCGAFDDIHAALMVHSQGNTPHPFVGTVKSGNGFIAEMIRYIGKTAHAAADPENGINALSAAVLGINAVNALRETFRDENHNRVHYIITKGGDTVNSIPADVRLECFVRSNSIDTIRQLLEKTNRAFVSGGDVIGAGTEIKLRSGYLPLACSDGLNAIFTEHARTILSEKEVVPVNHFNASTDMGDITHLMPAIHPLTGGVKGALHASDFEAVDYNSAIAVPAKIIVSTLIDLLTHDATKIKAILEKEKPLLSKQEYLSLLDSWFSE